MRTSKKFFILVLILIIAVAATACTAARKPEVNNNRNPMAQENKQADNLAKEAVKVDGVERAYVVVSGNMAVVGLDIDSNVDESATETVKGQVGERIRAADGQINDVRVATDPDTVKRIQRISSGIAEGKPITTFTKELDEIITRIAPTKE